MGRPKKFNREDVLEKALPLFWRQGFSSTGLQDLEKATGVNKSGLYSEFKDKADLFSASLAHYYKNITLTEALAETPLGWDNIEKFLKFVVQPCAGNQKGCFGVNSMRELEQIPEQARQMVMDSRTQLKRQLVKNISAEKTKLPPEAIAEMVSTFFSGLCIEQNLNSQKSAGLRKVDDFMKALRAL